MIPSEFERWFNALCARFPDTAAWYAKLPETSTEVGTPTREAVIQAWCDVLRDVDLRDGLTAIERVFAGDEDEPKTPQSWPKVIRRLAFEIRRKRPKAKRRVIDGQETYECPICEDTGSVAVYTKATIERFRAGVLVRGSRRTADNAPGIEQATVPCGCPRGGRNWMIKEMNAASYDDRHMCAMTVVMADRQYDEIEAWNAQLAGSTPF